MSADDKRSAGDAWMRSHARSPGRIDPEPVTREPTVGERASAAIRAAAARSLRRVAPPTDSTGR